MRIADIYGRDLEVARVSTEMVPFLCLVAFVGTMQGQPQFSFTGAWDGFFVTEGKLLPRGGSSFLKMDLLTNGTFHLHLENHVMVNMVQDADGTYKVAGNKVTLSGKAKIFFDDGYKGSTRSS